MFVIINPFTEERFATFSALSETELEKSVSSATQAQNLWSISKKKISQLTQFAKVLQNNQDSLACLVTKAMGKPQRQAQAEVKKSVQLCQYMIKYAEQFLAPQTNLPSAPALSYICFQPLGVILGIMPWNFPVWQVCRFAFPALLSGNTVLVKHAPNVMSIAVELEKLFLQAGFPSGVYSNIRISEEQTQKLIQDFRIRGVSLTGSVKAGRAVASTAGQYLKKTVLELGGSDAYLILDLVDLPHAVKECVGSRMVNNGQSCIAAKRFIVTQKNADDFIDQVITAMKAFAMGDPSIDSTTLGPLARKDLRDRLHTQVQMLKQKGASLLLGGQVPDRKGYFYPPTVLVSRKGDCVKTDEELFGPVAHIIVVDSEEEGIKVANSSSYGLGSAVFGTDVEKAQYIARDLLQAGAGVVNCALHSHPALPFGGIKDSGYGRELSSWGFYEFVNIKTIQT